MSNLLWIALITGITIVILIVIFIITAAANKLEDTIENAYAKHKNLKNPAVSARLSELYDQRDANQL